MKNKNGMRMIAAALLAVAVIAMMQGWHLGLLFFWHRAGLSQVV